MPTIQVQLSDVKQGRRSDGTLTNNVIFTATTSQGLQLTSEIDLSDIDTWPAFATWLLQQSPPFKVLPDKEKLIEITFHVETGTNPETGAEYSLRVFDGVTVVG
jgi:hypothetical protein